MKITIIDRVLSMPSQVARDWSNNFPSLFSAGVTMPATRHLIICLAAVLALDRSMAPAQEARGKTILLIDDHDILYRAGLKRVLQPARRHSDKALLGIATPWETAIGYTSVYRDPRTGAYQLWYQAYVGNRAGDRRFRCVVCYAESKDGIHFKRPELALFPYKEHKKTNIVLIGNGGYGDRYGCSVLVDPREPEPARRYKMAYYDWSLKNGREEPGLHVAFSPDGIHWTKHEHGPLLPTLYGGQGLQPPFADEGAYKETPVQGKPPRKAWAYPLTMSDVIDVFWDPVRQVFVIIDKFWIDAPDGGAAWRNALGRTESKDFIHWSKPQLVLAPDEDDNPEVEFHGAPAFFHKGRYFALNQNMYRRGSLAIDIELITSRDGFTWQRPFRKDFFLARSDKGLFDSRSIFTNSTPIVHGDEIRFYYGAYNQAPLGGVVSEPRERSGVGMASIPLDRFAGLRPVPRSEQATLRKPLENVGQVTFKPLDLKGRRAITLNADAAQGSIRAELLNEDGYRVRGFTRDDAVAIHGDSLRHPVAWKERSLERLPPGRYLLRLHLDNATLFAVSFD
jgi:hypothetical protein